MRFLPYLLLFVVLALFLLYAQRSRRRQSQADVDYAKEIAVGTEVMTTSGLYGTVVSLNGDGTAQLSVAPGLELKWALMALLDVASLPPDFVDAPEPVDAPRAAGTAPVAGHVRAPLQLRKAATSPRLAGPGAGPEPSN